MNHLSMQLVKFSSLFVACYLLAGCQLSQSSTQIRSINTINDAETTLAKVIADKSCDATYQCRVIAYGERACGGPSRFDIYSIKNSKQEEVEFLANEITQFEKAYNENAPEFSTCEHNPSPQSLCIANTCELIKRTH